MVIMPVFVIIPIFGYINRGQIQPVLNFCLRIVYNFMGSSDNMNCMDFEFLQHCDP